MTPSPIRRKLLKGSLAAPAVLTVSSASAQALTSFGRCLRGPTADGQPFFTAAPDNMFRRQVPVVQLSARGQVQGWYFLDQARNVFVNVEPPHNTLNFGEILAPGWQVTGLNKRWALVWFDKNTATQYARVTLQKPLGAVPATMSCYGSFARTHI